MVNEEFPVYHESNGLEHFQPPPTNPKCKVSQKAGRNPKNYAEASLVDKLITTWNEHLNSVVFAYNIYYKKEGTPFFMMHRCNPCIKGMKGTHVIISLLAELKEIENCKAASN